MDSALLYVNSSGLVAGFETPPVVSTIWSNQLEIIPSEQGYGLIRGGSDDGTILVGGMVTVSRVSSAAAWIADNPSTVLENRAYHIGPEFETPEGGGLGLFFAHAVNTPDYPGLVVDVYNDAEFLHRIGFWNAYTGAFIKGIGDGTHNGIVDVEMIGGELVIAVNGATGGELYSYNDVTPLSLSSLLPQQYSGYGVEIEAIFDHNGGLGVVAILTDSDFNMTRVILTFDAVSRVGSQEVESSYLYEVDFNGDGVFDASQVGGRELSLDHVFPTSGTYEVKVRATNVETGEFVENSQEVVVTAGMYTTNEDGTKKLTVGGTSSRDTFGVQTRTVMGPTGRVRVSGLYVQTGRVTEFFPFDGATEVVVYGGAGNDYFSLQGVPATITVYAYGGAGSDTMIGGQGPSFLDGGAGNDQLIAKNSRTNDILVGGTGRDTFIGANTDMVFSGTLSVSLEGVKQLLLVWNDQTKPIAERATLVGLSIPSASVVDDGEKDSIVNFRAWGVLGDDDFSSSLLRRYFHPITLNPTM
jgi:hypothetical protein